MDIENGEGLIVIVNYTTSYIAPFLGVWIDSQHVPSRQCPF